MQITEQRTLLRPLKGPWGALAQLLAFAIVSAATQVGTEIAGVSRPWAFALGFACAFAVINLRAVLAVPAQQRPWRSLTLHIALFTACTVIATALFGAQIFAHAP